MRYHYYSLLREWSLLDKKLCSCITSQCMDGKLWKIEMRFFREAQTSMFGLDHPDRLRSVLEIRSQSLKLLASTEKWKAGHHVTPCLCHAATLKTIYNIIICHTHKHIIELTHTANFLKRTPLHSSWHSWVLVQTSTPRQCVTTWCGSWYIQCNTRTIQSNTSNLYQTSFCCIDHHMTQVSHKPKKSLATTRGPRLGNLQGFSKGGFWPQIPHGSLKSKSQISGHFDCKKFEKRKWHTMINDHQLISHQSDQGSWH